MQHAGRSAPPSVTRPSNGCTTGVTTPKTRSPSLTYVPTAMPLLGWRHPATSPPSKGISSALTALEPGARRTARGGVRSLRSRSLDMHPVDGTREVVAPHLDAVAVQLPAD